MIHSLNFPILKLLAFRWHTHRWQYTQTLFIERVIHLYNFFFWEAIIAIVLRVSDGGRTVLFNLAVSALSEHANVELYTDVENCI